MKEFREEVGEVGMTEFERAQLIADEINCLHEDLLMCARSMHRTIFVFFTVFVGVPSIFFGKGIADENLIKIARNTFGFVNFNLMIEVIIWPLKTVKIVNN